MIDIAQRIYRRIKNIYSSFCQRQYNKCMEGYKINAPKKVVDYLHFKVVRHAKKQARLGNGNLLNELFFISFFVKAQKEPDEAAYNAWIHDFSDMAFDEGKRYRKALPSLNNNVPRLAFLGLGDDPSAYIHIYHICTYLKKSGDYKPYLFLFSPHDNLDKIKSQFNKIGTPIIIVPFNESTIINSSLGMREALANERIDIAVWVHLPTLMFSLFGMRIANKQIFLSQYLHPDLARFDIDGLLTYGNISEKESVFLHDNWRVMPSSLDIPLKTVSSADSLREKFAADLDTVILATFGRIEKIRQISFLEAVAEILHNTSNTIYLYTGYDDDADIASFFNKRHLDKRIRFIGWIDIDDYMPIVDLVLDSFPLATGITALKAMAYSKPVLSLGNAYSYMGRDIKPISKKTTFSGFPQVEQLFHNLKKVISSLPFQPYADNVADYINKAVALINDSKARKDFAEFQRLCNEYLYTNTDLMGSIFVEHINAIACNNRKSDNDV